MVWTKMLIKASLVTALAGGLMFFGNATNVRADDRDSCYQTVKSLEKKLDHDVDRHGADSRQAKRDRHDLDEAKDSCQRRFGNDAQEHHDRDDDRDRNRDNH